MTILSVNKQHDLNPRPRAGTFAGFPAEGLQFLRDLKANNERDWFRERKQVYAGQVEIPMALLVTEAAARCRQRGLMIHAKDKNPVMRVYRDIRFSPDKRPFKTHVGAGLSAPQGKTSYGEVYIHISPEESFVAAGFWMPQRSFLQAWREAMVKNPGGFLKAVSSLEKAGLKLSNESGLTRLPRGYDAFAESPIADFLKLTSYVTSQKLKAKEIRSPDLVHVVAEFALAARPLLDFGWKLELPASRDTLDERSKR